MAKPTRGIAGSKLVQVGTSTITISVTVTTERVVYAFVFGVAANTNVPTLNGVAGTLFATHPASGDFKIYKWDNPSAGTYNLVASRTSNASFTYDLGIAYVGYIDADPNPTAVYSMTDNFGAGGVAAITLAGMKAATDDSIFTLFSFPDNGHSTTTATPNASLAAGGQGYSAGVFSASYQAIIDTTGSTYPALRKQDLEIHNTGAGNDHYYLFGLVHAPYGSSYDTSLDIELDGKNSVYHADHSDFDITGDLSVEAWVKLKQVPGSSTEYTLISKYNDATNQRQWRVGIKNPSGTVGMMMATSTNGTSFTEGQVAYPFEAGKWYHCAWTKTGTTFNAYVNGVLVGTSTVAATQFAGSARLDIGAYYDGSAMTNPSDSYLKHVRIFADLRTASEIVSDMMSASVSDANLRGQWAFNGTLADSSGLAHNLTWQNTYANNTIQNLGATYVRDVPRITAPFLSLDLESGSSQYASIADGSQTGLDITPDMTIEAWIRLESRPSNTERYGIVGKFDSSGQWSYTMSYERDDSTGDTLCLNTSANGTTQVQAKVVVPDLELGVWYHVAITKSGTTATAYLNGRNMGTGTVASTLFNSTSAFHIGREGSGTGKYFDGQIKGVRIFSDVRTQSEIISDAWSNSVSDANLKGEWLLDGTLVDTSGNANHLTGSGTPGYLTDIPWTAPAGMSVALEQHLRNGLVSYWTLDEASGSRYDSEALNTLSDNGSTGAATGKKSNGADFENANVSSGSQYLSIADATQVGLDITGDMAISFWMKAETAVHGNPIAKWLTTGNQRSYRFEISSTTLTFQTSPAGSTEESVTYTPGGTLFSTGTWYHIVAVKKGTAGFLFIDGKLVATATFGTATQLNGSGAFTIGAIANPTNYFDGVIDEVAIFNRALGYGEVLDLYANGNAITWAGATQYLKSLIATAVATITWADAITILKALAVTATAVPKLFKGLAKTLSVTAVGTPSIIRAFAKNLQANATAFASMAAGLLYTKTLQATATATASIIAQKVRIVNMVATATATVSLTFNKHLSQALVATASAQASLSRVLSLTKSMAAVAVAQTSIGTMKAISVTLQAIATAMPGVSKALSLSMALTAIGNAITSIGRDYGYLDKYPEQDVEDTYQDKYPLT